MNNNNNKLFANYIIPVLWIKNLSINLTNQKSNLKPAMAKQLVCNKEDNIYYLFCALVWLLQLN
jgi:hypothetical protein